MSEQLGGQPQLQRVIERYLDNFKKLGRNNLSPAKIRSRISSLKETWNQFMRLEVTLHGSWNSFSAPFPGEEWRTAADKLASGELRWEFMITHELPLAELPAMMTKLGERSEFSSKVIFVPNAG